MSESSESLELLAVPIRPEDRDLLAAQACAFGVAVEDLARSFLEEMIEALDRRANPAHGPDFHQGGAHDRAH